MFGPNRFALILAACWMILTSLSAHAQVYYQDWKGGFTWPSIEASAPEADPDNDGMTNLIEYAFGSDPLHVGSGNLSYLPAMVHDSARQPVFRFYRNTAFSDIEYIVESSTDLKNWTVVSETLVEIIAQSGTWQTCIVRMPSGEKARFYRVRVNYNAESTEPGRETYDPSQGIGTVVTPNPFLPDADLKIPKGVSVDPGTPTVGVTTGVIDRQRSDLNQSTYAPMFHPATEFAGHIETYIGKSGGTAKIGSYELPIPVNQKFPFRVQDWANALDRANIYPITFTNIEGVDWDYTVAPANFTTAWTSYEKTITSRAIRDARVLYPDQYPIGWQSANANYLATGTIVGSGRLIGDLADTTLSSEEKRGVVSMFTHAHAYGGNGEQYPRTLSWTGMIAIDGDGVSRGAYADGATIHSSDISFNYDDPNKFKYTALAYCFKEYGGDKGLKPGVVYKVNVHLLVSRYLTTQKISDNYFPETRPTTDYVEMRFMGGLALPPQCVVEEWDIERGMVDEYSPNQFIFTATLSEKEEHWTEPMAVKATAYFTYREETTMLTAGVDETSGARYRKVGLNGHPLPDGKPQSAGESDQQSEDTFIDAMTLQLRHEVTDAYTPVPTSDLALEVRRSVNAEVWSHRFGLRPSERVDLPFGVGWRSNLSPSIRFEDSYGTTENPPTVPTATVTDEQGSSYRFLVERTGEIEKFTPFPTAKHEQSVYLCKLEKVGNEYHFIRKYGTKLIYQKVGGMQSIPSDRMVTPINHEDFYSYARLQSVTDRMGNSIDYTYPTSDTSLLIPSRIAVRDRPGLKIDIHTSADGVVTDIWDVNGYQTSYRYEKLADGVQVLKEIVHPNGEITKYTYDLATDLDLRPKNDSAAKPDPDFSHYHCDLASITDAENRAYRFEYRFDRSKDDFSVRNGYYTKTGVPRNVYKTHLPNGEVGAIFTNESRIRFFTEGSAEDVVLRQDGVNIRKNSITGSPNNPDYAYTRTYQWSDPVLSVVKVPQRLFGDGPIPPSPILIYYRKMDITMPEIGTETFTFEPNAGLALSSATDLSGNVTRFYYEDAVSDDTVDAYNNVFVGKPAESSGQVLLNSYYNDTTRQINAKAQPKFYTYNAQRMLESIIDELGRVTRYDFDGLGRRWRERVFESSSSANPVREVAYTYGNSSFPGFVTRKAIIALNGTDTDVVTEYEPDEYGRIKRETLDPDGLALSSYYVYSIGGDLLKETDARGHVTAYAYDKQHKVTDIYLSNNTAKHYSYDKIGNKIEETDERGNRTSYEYDALNRVSKTIRHMNGIVPDIVTGQIYNPLNQPLEATDARGFKTLYAFDKIGRPVSITTPTVTTNDGNGNVQTQPLVTRFYYDGANAGGSVFLTTPLKPTLTVGSRGYRTYVIYDELYRPIETRNEYASGQFASIKTDYDAVGNAYQHTDPLGKITKIDHDALNRPIETKSPDGGIRKTSYTTTGLIYQITDELNHVTTYEYDTAGRLVKTTLPEMESGEPITTNEYDANGNLVATTDARGNRMEMVYDALNRKTWDILPEILDTEKNVYAHPIVKTEYDEAGNVIKTTDARGFVSEVEYDAANRPIRQISPVVYVLNDHVAGGGESRPVTKIEYDANGNVSKTIDAKGNETTNSYDALNRLKSTTDAEGQTVNFGYDAVGNRTAVTDGKGNTTRFTYDGLNRNTSIIDAAGRSTTLVFDEKNMVRRTDAQGRVASYTYDGCNRLKTVSYTGRSQDNLVYTYDLRGNILSVTMPNDPTGNRDVAYFYDATKNLKSEQSGRGAGAIIHRHFYDIAGNLMKTIYGGTDRELVSTYDSHNRLATMTEVGRTTSYTYDRNGNVIKKVLPNRDTTQTTFDALNRQISIAVGNGTNPLQHFSYAYDAIGNVTWIAETHRDSSLSRIVENSYDKTHRLVKEKTTGAGAGTVVYTYDAANNRESMTLDGVATAYAYNSLNQLTSHADNTGTTTYTYDLDGNRTGRTKGTETTAYIYDYENRLLSVVEPTMTHSYEYDYRTRRIARTEGANVARIVFSGGTSYAEYAAGNGLASPTVEYVRGSDYGGGVGGILYTLRSGNASYTHYNNRGDVTAKTNDVGTATYQAIYEAFGTRTDEVGGTLDRQKANTKDEDPTGLLNEGFRYRDLETGTFITRDPLGFVDGPNLYAYVMQNPWTSFDPHGLEMISDVKSDAWARANLNDPDKWREEMEGRNRVAAAVADWAIGFVSYATAALVKGYIMTNSRGESRMDDFRDYPEIQAALLDLQEKVPDAIIQKPRDFVTYVTGVPDDDPARNTMETVLDVGSLFLGFGKMALGAPKYFKMAKLLFTEAKTAMALAAKQRQGMAAMERFRKIKAWYMQGSEADAAWMKMSLKDRLLYEIGQKTMKKKKYEQYEHIADVVQRGEKLVLDEGWYRAIRSTPEGLKLGIGSTFHTGPTPGIRWAAKRAVQATAIGSAVLAGYLVYEAATENDQ